MGVRRAAGAGAAVALVATGVYLFVYLFRWEWHRAIVAGILFVATEVALAAGVVLRRLSALDRRLDSLGDRLAADHMPADRLAVDRLAVDRPLSPSPAVLARIRASAPPPRKHFAWLQPDQFEVFLPILLGAGVLASALAWVVEGLSRATARPVLEQGLANRLVALSLPDGGLLGPPPPSLASPLAARDRGRRLGRAAVLLAVSVAGFGALDALADASQTRPDRLRSGVVTDIDLRLAGARAAQDPEEGLRHLWGACSNVLGRIPPVRIYDLGDGALRLEVGTDLGLYGRRKLRGCLEDATVDRLQARVLAVTARAGPASGAATSTDAA